MGAGTRTIDRNEKQQALAILLRDVVRKNDFNPEILTEILKDFKISLFMSNGDIGKMINALDIIVRAENLDPQALLEVARCCIIIIEHELALQARHPTRQHDDNHKMAWIMLDSVSKKNNFGSILALFVEKLKDLIINNYNLKGKQMGVSILCYMAKEYDLSFNALKTVILTLFDISLLDSNFDCKADVWNTMEKLTNTNDEMHAIIQNKCSEIVKDGRNTDETEAALAFMNRYGSSAQ